MNLSINSGVIFGFCNILNAFAVGVGSISAVVNAGAVASAGVIACGVADTSAGGGAETFAGTLAGA